MKVVSQSHLMMIKDYYSLVDSNQPDKFINYFFEDAIFRFANSEGVKGHEAIRKILLGLLNSVNKIEHKITNAWEEGNIVFIECDVTYTRKDNKQVVVHGAVVNVIENGLFKEQRLYVDITPVFA